MQTATADTLPDLSDPDVKNLAYTFSLQFELLKDLAAKAPLSPLLPQIAQLMHRLENELSFGWKALQAAALTGRATPEGFHAFGEKLIDFSKDLKQLSANVEDAQRQYNAVIKS
jgi:hypothetical protein